MTKTTRKILKSLSLASILMVNVGSNGMAFTCPLNGCTNVITYVDEKSFEKTVEAAGEAIVYIEPGLFAIYGIKTEGTCSLLAGTAQNKKVYGKEGETFFSADVSQLTLGTCVFMDNQCSCVS